MGVVTSAAELLDRYDAGERNFDGARLSGIDLSGAELPGISLVNSNLSGCSLVQSDLRNARLDKTCFRKADLSQADLRDASLDAADVGMANFEGVNLASASLKAAKLQRIHLVDANMHRAALDDASLQAAVLKGADLSYARLRRADLREAELSFVNFTQADLSQAQMQSAALIRALLNETRLKEADLHNANISQALLVGVSLAPFCVATVQDQGYPNIDYRSVLLSFRANGVRDFLRRCGWPQVLIDYNLECAESLGSRGVFNLLQSTFISFGEPDKVFAKRLNDALHAEGVRTFFFPRDARPGQPLMEVMYRGVNDHDRVILVCSATSLSRPAVLQETKLALDREMRLSGRLLIIPVAIDDYLFTCQDDSLVIGSLRNRVIADFRDSIGDGEKFHQQIGRLVSTLKRDDERDVPSE